MYFNKTPWFFQKIFPTIIWKLWGVDQIYLTFDDGPIPESTPFILDTLKAYDAKATFFCVGENVKRYPELFQRILDEGHAVGNHTFNHLNGWKSDNDDYVKNVEVADEVVQSKLFRPPYGRLKPEQLKRLQQKYNVIFWDVLSGDWDASVSSEQLFDNVTAHAKEGSIIVLHDNLKSIDKLKETLPAILKFYSDKGIKMIPLPQEFEG